MGEMDVIPEKKRNLVKKLMSKRVSNVKFDGEYVSFTFDGRTIRNKVRPRKCLPWVGTWNRKNNTVYFDDDMAKNKKELLSLAVHESVEAYVGKRYGLRSTAEGHYVAENVERKFAQSSGVHWPTYQWRAEFVHRKETERKDNALKNTIRLLKKELKKKRD